MQLGLSLMASYGIALAGAIGSLPACNVSERCHNNPNNHAQQQPGTTNGTACVICGWCSIDDVDEGIHLLIELLHNAGDSVDMSYMTIVHAVTQQTKDRLQLVFCNWCKRVRLFENYLKRCTHKLLCSAPCEMLLSLLPGQ